MPSTTHYSAGPVNNLLGPYQACCRLLADIRWPGPGDHYTIYRACAEACLQRLLVSRNKLYCPPLDGSALHTALGASPEANRVLLAADIDSDNKFIPWLQQLVLEDATFNLTVKQMGVCTELLFTLRLPALLIPSASPHLQQDQVWSLSRLCFSLKSEQEQLLLQVKALVAPFMLLPSYAFPGKDDLSAARRVAITTCLGNGMHASASRTHVVCAPVKVGSGLSCSSGTPIVLPAPSCCVQEKVSPV